MKAIILTLFALLLLPSYMFSQSNKPHKTIFIITNGIDGEEVIAHSLIINSLDIEKLELLNINETKRKYGNDSSEVAMKITPKSSIKLIKLADFYRLHNIQNPKQSFPVSVDGKVIRNHKDMLIEDSEVKSVELINDTVIISTKSGYSQLMKAKKNIQ